MQKRKEDLLQSVSNNFLFQYPKIFLKCMANRVLGSRGPTFCNSFLKISNCCFKDIIKGVTYISSFTVDSVSTVFKLSGLITNNSHSFHQQPFFSDQN